MNIHLDRVSNTSNQFHTNQVESFECSSPLSPIDAPSPIAPAWDLQSEDCPVLQNSASSTPSTRFSPWEHLPITPQTVVSSIHPFVQQTRIYPPQPIHPIACQSCKSEHNTAIHSLPVDCEYFRMAWLSVSQ